MSQYPVVRRVPKRRGWPLVTLGYLWQQDEPSRWKRHIVRRNEESGEVDVEELTYVEASEDGGFDVCMKCLSQNVSFVVAEWVWLVCHNCPRNEDGSLFRFRFCPAT